MVKDRRAVLAAEIEALPVAGSRIVDPPERLEQLRVADLGRVEPDLDLLRVSGAVAASRIVDPPERLEQLRVACLGRVEPDLDRLRVTVAVPADPLVGRVRDVAAGIPGSGPQHPVDLAEGRLDAPEASRSAGRRRSPG